MRRKRLLALLTLSLILVAGQGWRIWHRNDPVHQGKRLSAWIEQYFQNLEDGAPQLHPKRDDALRDRAAQAIRQLGTNALPYLVRLAATPESAFRKKIAGSPLAERFAHLPGMYDPFVNWAFKSMLNPQKALRCFELLGPAGQLAVPDLIRLLRTAENPSSREAAAYSLGYVGPAAAEALPDLASGLNDPSVREACVKAVHDIGFDRTNGQFREDAARRLIPRLTELLLSQNEDTVLYAIKLVEALGDRAKAAAPALVPLLKHPGYQISSTAAKALRRVDPAAARAAGLE